MLLRIESSNYIHICCLPLLMALEWPISMALWITLVHMVAICTVWWKDDTKQILQSIILHCHCLGTMQLQAVIMMTLMSVTFHQPLLMNIPKSHIHNAVHQWNPVQFVMQANWHIKAGSVQCTLCYLSPSHSRLFPCWTHASCSTQSHRPSCQPLVQNLWLWPWW